MAGRRRKRTSVLRTGKGVGWCVVMELRMWKLRRKKWGKNVLQVKEEKAYLSAMKEGQKV